MIEQEQVFKPDNKSLPNLLFKLVAGRGVWIAKGDLTDEEKKFILTIPASEKLEHH